MAFEEYIIPECVNIPSKENVIESKEYDRFSPREISKAIFLSFVLLSSCLGEAGEYLLKMLIPFETRYEIFTDASMLFFSIEKSSIIIMEYIFIDKKLCMQIFFFIV